MSLNDDFTLPVLIHSDALPWQASPMPGVDRRMLDRIGGEVARATTIVRYAAGSRFSAHTHTGGEEYLVLDGVFQDEHGDFPTGTYVRNPPTSRHTPGSDAGCVIFVKLWQFDMEDRTRVRVEMGSDMSDAGPGVRVQLLHRDPRETVTFEDWAEGARVARDLPGGAEILVLSGTATVGGAALAARSWLRLPAGAALTAVAGAGGATVWIKAGHLPFAKAPEA